MTAVRLRPLARSLAVLALLGLAGCASLPRDEDAGPVRVPQNVRGPESWPREIRRVAVLPAHDASGRLTGEFVSGYDASWARALASTQRAEFVGVSRTTLFNWTGRETLDSTQPLPPGLLGRIAAETGSQAVMFLDLTEVAPYPPLSLAFRARLAAPADGETVWMVDEIFDTRDAATARGARRDARARESGAGDPTSAIQQSPSRFADHAFRAVAALLPPRLPDAPAGKPPAAAAKPGPDDADALRAKKFPVRADNTAR